MARTRLSLTDGVKNTMTSRTNVSSGDPQVNVERRSKNKNDPKNDHVDDDFVEEQVVEENNSSGDVNVQQEKRGGAAQRDEGFAHVVVTRSSKRKGCVEKRNVGKKLPYERPIKRLKINVKGGKNVCSFIEHKKTTRGKVRKIVAEGTDQEDEGTEQEDEEDEAEIGSVVEPKKVKRGKVKKIYSEGTEEEEPEDSDVEAGEKGNNKRTGNNIKKERDNRRFIRRKFTPELFSEMIAGLNDNQRKWVTNTGFGGLLDFRMTQYPRRLGYSVAKSFDVTTCSLILEAGNVEISESVVNKVLGLPIGTKKIVFTTDNEAEDLWAEQFGNKSRSQITPRMVYNKMNCYEAVDKIFKLNFLVLTSNFLIESNANAYVNRQILHLTGNVDQCWELKWCELLVCRLKSCHTYWARDPACTHFTGSLPFLIYLYVDRVKNDTTRDVVRTTPAFIGWSDGLLRERQKNELGGNCFGTGVILKWDEEHDKSAEVEEDMNGVADLGFSLAADGLDTEDVAQDSNVELEKNETVLRNNIDPQEDDAVEEERALSDNEDDTVERDEEEFYKMLQKKMDILKDIFDDCGKTLENAQELFPDNPNNEVLRIRLSKIVEHRANITPERNETWENWPTQFTAEARKLAEEVSSKKSMEANFMSNNDLPSFSLGVTQIEPRDLCSELDKEDTVVVGNLTKVVICPKDKFEQGQGYEQNEAVNVGNRPRREPKPAATKKSPWVARGVELKGRQISSEEEAVWDWLFKDKRNKNEAIYVFIDKQCTKSLFQTMKYNSWVEGSVIDCWTYYLNDKERLKSPYSPLRFFFTVESTVVAIGDNEKNMEERYANFTEHIDMVMGTFNFQHKKTYAAKDIEMFVFPIHQGAHHYVICYDVKNLTWDIVDNRAKVNANGDNYNEDVFSEIYGDVPQRLHTLFVRWLEFERVAVWEKVRDLKPAVVEMDWQTRNNDVDCGVFVMRHMETYMGRNKWSRRLATESNVQRGQLEKLRKIYCYLMLTSPCNEKRSMIKDAAQQRYKQGNARRGK